MSTNSHYVQSAVSAATEPGVLHLYVAAATGAGTAAAAAATNAAAVPDLLLYFGGGGWLRIVSALV